MTRKRLLLAAGLLVLVLAPVLIRSAYWMHLLIMSSIYVVLSLSLDITYGYAGLINLGQATFYAIGAYTTALLMLRLGWPYWPAMLVAGLIGALFGVLIGVPTLRMRGLYLCIATLGFNEIVRLVLKSWISFTRGPMGLPGIPSPAIGPLVIEGKTEYYYLILVILLLTAFTIRRLATSRVGVAWLAIKDDETAAEVAGIPTAKYRVMAFTLGAFFAGIAGSFYAVYISFIAPDSFKTMESTMIFAMPAVGGPGTMLGPVLGALILYLLPELTRAFAEYRMMWVGGLLVLTMILAPKGIVGTLTAWRARSRPAQA